MIALVNPSLLAFAKVASDTREEESTPNTREKDGKTEERRIVSAVNPLNILFAESSGQVKSQITCSEEKLLKWKKASK